MIEGSPNTFKKSEHIKLVSMDDDKVLIFVIVNRKFSTNDIFSNEDVPKQHQS
jgi:hypothetical protein